MTRIKIEKDSKRISYLADIKSDLKNIYINHGIGA
jgi:hypothetical protein